MRKVIAGIILLVVILFLSFLIAAPNVNNYAAKKTADELVNLPLPEHTEYIEDVYKAGKLAGNGNGMQYFGAILIRSELSLEELKKYYSDLAENELDYVVEKQADKDIKAVEHEEMVFDTIIDGNNYYIVYSWGENDTVFHEFDIRGH